MSHELIEIADGFYNVRAPFRVMGFLNINTQCSLARLRSGGFALLDACAMPTEVKAQVDDLTDGGRAVEAVLHLHPFHTVFVKAVASMFPDAKHYGTSRHHGRASDVEWEPETTDSDAFAALFADDFDFMVPPGVHLIPDDENLHFASVLAFHRASRTLHVDDTLSWLPLPFGNGRLMFHPTLAKTLEEREGAAEEFRGWAEQLVGRCAEVEHVCPAHFRLPGHRGTLPGGVASHVRNALSKVQKTLDKHARKHG